MAWSGEGWWKQCRPSEQQDLCAMAKASYRDLIWRLALIHFDKNISYATPKSLQSCPTLRPPRRQPPRLPRPWDSPGKNTGVGCHFLLQCMTVKSQSEVAQSCPTLSDPMDCSLPGSSVCGILQARVLEWGAIAFSDISYKWVFVVWC